MQLAIPMARKSSIEGRLRALLDERRSRRGVTRLTFLLAATVAATILIPLAAARVGDAQESDSKETTAQVNLTSPQATIHSFVAALNKADVKAVSACVAGGKHPAALAELERMLKAKQAVFSVDKLRVETKGETATAEFEFLARGSLYSREAYLQLRRQGSQWKIMPGDPDSIVIAKYGDYNSDVLENLATYFAYPEKPLAKVQALKRVAEAQAGKSLGNAKQIALGGMRFLAEHDSKFTLKADSYKESLLPYVGSEQFFYCPEDKSGGLSYSFNRNLEGVRLSMNLDAIHTVMIYEGRDEKLNFHHSGHAIVIFVDGHVEMISPELTKKLLWKPPFKP